MVLAELTPMQLIWSIFTVAVIVMLFVLYHLHLEKRHKDKGRK